MSFGWTASAAPAAPSSGPAASRAARGRAMSGLGCSGTGTGAASTGALGARLAAAPARCRRDRRRSALAAWRAPPLEPAPRAAAAAAARLLPRATDGPTSRRADVSARARAVTGETLAGDPAALLADVRAGQFRRLRSRELNEALQYLGRGANWRLVYDVFDQLLEPDDDPADAEAPSSPPNSHVATTVLSIAGRKGDLERVRSIFQWMRAQGPGRSAPTAYTYTAYIQAVGAAGRWREAFAAYRDMRADGISPTTHTYSALIRGGAKGGKVGANAAAALVEDMRLDGVSPDVPIASALICAYGVAGQFANAERMLRAVEAVTAEAYDERRAKEDGGVGASSTPTGGSSVSSGSSRRSRGGRRPDAKLYTEFLIAACRCGRPDAAAEVFESADFPRTTYTCTAAIKAYGECDAWEKAEELYERMTAEGGAVAPTGITHTAMLSAYEKCQRWERAVAFLSRLNERADAAAAAEKERTGVDPRASASGSNPGAVDAEELHFNIAMSACGKCGEWREAERLFREMLARGVTPTSVTYSTLIAAYGRGGEEARATRRFREMIERGLKPDDYTVVGLLLAPAGRGDLATCVETKEEMRRKHGVKATVHVYNELIRAASVGKRYETAVETYQAMVREGVEPNATTQELLADVGKKGVEYYEDQQLAASFGSLVAGLVGVAGMMAGRW